MNIYINSFGTSNVNISDPEISTKVEAIFDLRPVAIINRLKLKNPIYFKTAAYGHMGREPNKETFVLKKSESIEGQEIKKDIETFPWEKLDYVDIIKNQFNI